MTEAAISAAPKMERMNDRPVTDAVSDTRHWLVVFRDSPVGGWWRWWTAPGRRHVFAMTACGDQATLWFDPLAAGTDVVVTPIPLAEAVARFTAGGATILLCRPRSRVLSIWRPQTCVEAVKALLGIRAWWVFGTSALLHHLIATGAQPIAALKESADDIAVFLTAKAGGPAG